MIEIDLKTRVIRKSARIWAVHPGRQKIFEDEFRRANRVFLDLPKLDLQLADNLNIPLLRRKINRSQAWHDYFLRRRRALAAGTELPDQPSMELTNYSESIRSRALSNTQTNVTALFFTARPGDLILVPTGRGQFGHVHFCEIVSDFNPKNLANIGGDIDYNVAFRTVRWLGPKPQRRDVSEALARRLENRRAVINVERSVFGTAVYSAAYENFKEGSRSKVTLHGPNYSSKNAWDIVEAVEITSWLVAAFEAISREEASAISRLSVRQLIEKFYPRSMIEDLEIEFSSPGKIAVLSRKQALAAFVAGGLVLVGLSTDVPLRPQQLVVKNSKSANQIDTDAIRSLGEETAALKALIRSLTPSRRSEISSLANKAKDHIGFQSAAKVEIGVQPRSRRGKP